MMVALAIVLLADACGREKAPESALGSNAVAEVAGVPITSSEFVRTMALRSGNGVRFDKAQDRRTLLGEMIDQEALYAKAVAAGFDKRPEVRREIKQIIADRFREEELAHFSDPQPVTDEDVRAYYDQHQTNYRRPPAIHAAMIFMRISPTASPERRAAVVATARAVLKEAEAAATSEQFDVIVQKHSDDQATRYRGGDLGWVSQSAPPWGMDPAAVKELFALQKAGAFSPVVDTGKGAYIFKALAIKPDEVRPFEEVSQAIRHLLQREAQTQRQQRFYGQMRAGLVIRTNDALLDRLAPGGPPNGRAPPPLPATVAQIKNP